MAINPKVQNSMWVRIHALIELFHDKHGIELTMNEAIEVYLYIQLRRTMQMMEFGRS